MTDFLYFTMLNDTKPDFNPIFVEVDPKDKNSIKEAIKNLIIKYKFWYDTEIGIEHYDDREEKLIIDDIDEIKNDIYDVQQHVFGHNKYYCVAFAINKDPCIVWSKGCPKRKYRWEDI